VKLLSLLALCLVGSIASAQPAPAPAPAVTGDKSDAKSLMASGLKLYSTKDYLGALAMFKEAYDRFPSSKILLNIGTTLKALGRDAEAANTYQRFLDSSDVDEAKKPAVLKELAELDAKLAVVVVTATPADAEIQFGSEPWHAAADLSRYRLDAGQLTLHARKDGYQPWEKALGLTAGVTMSVAIDLAPVPPPEVKTTEPAVTTGGVHAAVTPETPPSPWGAIAVAHVDIKYKGAAGVVGVTRQLMPGLQVEAAAILGPSAGGYVGGRYALLQGSLHPVIAAGVPMFVSSGARFGVRGAGGVEFELNRHIALLAELGVEHMFNPQANIAGTLFIPAIGALGRM
jgi:hypothetical protein